MDIEQRLAEQHEIDRQTVEELLADGSNPEVDHTLEHHFFSEDFQRLEKAALAAFELGEYEVTDAEGGEDEDGNTFYCIDLISEQPQELERIQAETESMLKLADKFGIEYDGWGTFFED